MAEARDPSTSLDRQIRIYRSLANAPEGSTAHRLRHVLAEHLATRYAFAEDIPAALKADHDFFLALVAKNGMALGQAQTGSEWYRAAVPPKPGETLDFSRPRMVTRSRHIGPKTDFAIVQAAVRQNGLALQHADEEGKTNRELAREAILQNPRSFIHTRLRADPETALFAIERDPSNYQHVAPALRADLGFVLRALAVQPEVAADIPEAAPVRRRVGYNQYLPAGPMPVLRGDPALVEGAGISAQIYRRRQELNLLIREHQMLDQVSRDAIRHFRHGDDEDPALATLMLEGVLKEDTALRIRILQRELDNLYHELDQFVARHRRAA